MLIKFFPNGKGAGPVGYLVAERVLAYEGNRDLIRDAGGQPVTVTRDPLPEVLRGNPEQFEVLWVRHAHEGWVELHFCTPRLICTPRLKLTTGKSLNIAPSGYQDAYDSLRDVMNQRHGWADPMDVERAKRSATQSRPRPAPRAATSCTHGSKT